MGGKRGSLEERFWRRVRKTDGCWLWTGKPMRVGYGYIGKSFPKRDCYAHRVSWEIHNGPIPEGRFVLHVCDTPLCVNPAHLFLGSHADNMRDMGAKGRSPHGTRHWNVVLTDDLVREIADWTGDGISHSATAKHFGVSRQLVDNIVSGRNWSHITRGAQ